MADTIDISAVARVIDQASGPLKAIQGVVQGVAESAKQTQGFFGGLGDKISGAFGGMAGPLKQAGSSLATFASQASRLIGPLSGLTSLLGLGGVAASINEFAGESRELMRTATALGVTTDALQKFRYAAGNADVADTTLRRLRQTLVTLNRGGKATEATVEQLGKMGINIEMIRAGRLDEILPQMIRDFEGIVDPQERTNLAMALFQKSWSEVMPFLAKGTAGLAEGEAKFAKFGDTLQELQAASAADAAMRDLALAIGEAREEVAKALLPYFTPLVKWLGEFIANNQGLLKQVALPALIASIAAAVGSLGVAVAGALGPWGLLATAIVAAATALYNNWGNITQWIDDNLGGVATAIGKVADHITGQFKELWQNVSEGWQTGGLVGAIEGLAKTYTDSWKRAFDLVGRQLGEIDWSGIGQRLVEAFNNIDWNAIGRRIGTLLGEALMAPFKLAVDIGEWLAGLDWNAIGTGIGKALIGTILLALRAMTGVTEFAGELGKRIVDGVASVDWGEVAVKILTFFGQLQAKFIQIGLDLIKGLISGMIDAIPGLRDVTNRIEGAFRNIGSSVRGALPSWLGGSGGTPSLPAAANTNTPPPNLLQRAGAAGAANSNVDFNVNVSAPPGSAVSTTATQSGAPVNVEVGRSDFATGTG